MPQHDQLHRYLFENFAVRGELVTVSETLQQILENHTYPQPVKTVLAELLVATSLLTATLKFAGDITVQLQGDGPLSLAVINGNNNQQMRGVARVWKAIRWRHVWKITSCVLSNCQPVCSFVPVMLTGKPLPAECCCR